MSILWKVILLAYDYENIKTKSYFKIYYFNYVCIYCPVLGYVKYLPKTKEGIRYPETRVRSSSEVPKTILEKDFGPCRGTVGSVAH